MLTFLSLFRYFVMTLFRYFGMTVFRFIVMTLLFLNGLSFFSNVNSPHFEAGLDGE